MKITNIDVTGVLGIRSAAVTLTKPVALFAAPNGNGKTSLAEAVRMALGGDLVARGVKLKKDLQALVHDGMKDGSAEVEIGGDTIAFAHLPKGVTTPAAKYTPHPMLPYVMEPERFAALDEKARGAMLFELLGIKMSPKAVIERLAKRGIDQAKAERVGPLLKAGFQEAEKAAREKATQAKGAWRQITGETYGSEKGKTWEAAVPEHDAGAAAAIAQQLQQLDAELEQAQKAIGSDQATADRRAQLQAKLPALKAKVDTYQRVDNKLTADRAGLAEWEQKLSATKAEAGQGKRVGLVHDLAAALAGFFDEVYPENTNFPREVDAPAANEAARVLDAYEAEHGQIGVAGNPEAAGRLPEYQRSRDLMANAVAAGERDLAAIKQAQAEAELIEQELAHPFDSEALANGQRQIATLKAKRAELVKQGDSLRVQKAAADAAGKKTAEAAEHHADVEAWTACADALAPNGIPGEMLAEGLAPFNERLQQSATDADWFVVRVRSDMSIEAQYVGEDVARPHKLLSESEQWRANAMLAEAVSHFAGLKFLMLDRFDVLDLGGRAEALLWLQTLAELGELDTALVFATLKAAAVGDDFRECFWLEHGEIAAELEAA